MSVAAKITPFIALFVGVAWVAPAIADPPAHAPAHGWRKKHDASYVGYTGKEWERDYEVLSGHCDREAIATVVGGVVGGVVGAHVDSGNRTVATIIGAAVGALIGNRIGHALDEADRGCFGHVLEVGRSGRRVVWTNEAIGVRYELSPGADRKRDGVSCREFTLVAVAGAEKSSHHGVACPSQPGLWQIVE